MMSKNSKFLIGIIVALIIIIAVTVFLNRDNAAEKSLLNENAVFIIIENGNEIASYNMEEIIGIGEQDFSANLKKNGQNPISLEYTGVLLKSIFAKAGVTLDGKSVVIVTAADGYVVAIDIEKVMEDNNVFLAYKREGQIIGSRESGGDGPYQLIISKDQFSQYWCKYALSAEVK